MRVGADAYRHLDELPFLDLVTRPFAVTTADPAGSNADSGHPVRAAGAGRVLADLAGPGVVTFMRMQETYGSPWTIAVDGAAPVPVAPSDLGRPSSPGGVAAAMAYPLSLDVDEDQGSSIVAVPIGFQRSLLWTSIARNGNFYALGRRLPAGAAVATWTPATRADDVARLLSRAGADLAPAGATRKRGAVVAGAGETTVVTLQSGPSELRDLHLAVLAPAADALASARLRIYWDGASVPAVDAPLGFVAGDGAGVFHPSGRPLVGGLLSGMAWRDGPGGPALDVRLGWPMPFRRNARITLTPASGTVGSVAWSAATTPLRAPDCVWAPFHATYTDHGAPTSGADLDLLDATGSGRIVGTVVNFGRVGPTLEGDPRIYVDGSRTPQVVATGTEEWGLGGDYWHGGHQTTLPLGGLPSTTGNPSGRLDGAALYRTLVADSVPFLHDVRVRLEHGAADDSTERYRTCVLWYGRPDAAASVTDAVVPGDPAAAAAHHLDAPAAEPVSATGGFEYTVRAASVAGHGLASAGPVTAELALPAGARGAFLRWMFDASVPDQRAQVLVDGRDAGTLWAPGASTAADAAGVVRRWREVELPLPSEVVAGRRSLRVTLRPDPPPLGGAPRLTVYGLQLWAVTGPGLSAR